MNPDETGHNPRTGALAAGFAAFVVFLLGIAAETGLAQVAPGFRLFGHIQWFLLVLEAGIYLVLVLVVLRAGNLSVVRQLLAVIGALAVRGLMACAAALLVKVEMPQETAQFLWLEHLASATAGITCASVIILLLSDVLTRSEGVVLDDFVEEAPPSASQDELIAELYRQASPPVPAPRAREPEAGPPAPTATWPAVPDVHEALADFSTAVTEQADLEEPAPRPGVASALEAAAPETPPLDELALEPQDVPPLDEQPLFGFERPSAPSEPAPPLVAPGGPALVVPPAALSARPVRAVPAAAGPCVIEGDALRIPCEWVLAQVPDRTLALTADEVRSALPAGCFSVGLGQVIEQLVEGEVRISIGDLLRQLPTHATVTTVAELERRLPEGIALPLDQVVNSLPAGTFSPPEGQLPPVELVGPPVFAFQEPADCLVQPGGEPPSLSGASPPPSRAPAEEPAAAPVAAEIAAAPTEESELAPPPAEVAPAPEPSPAEEAAVEPPTAAPEAKLPPPAPVLAGGGPGAARQALQHFFPGEEILLVSADRVLVQLPDGVLAEEVADLVAKLPAGKLAVPLAAVVRQLSDGQVFVDVGMVVRQLPPRAIGVTMDLLRKSLELGMMELPLDEIVPQVPRELLVPRGVREDIPELDGEPLFAVVAPEPVAGGAPRRPPEVTPPLPPALEPEAPAAAQEVAAPEPAPPRAQVPEPEPLPAVAPTPEPEEVVLAGEPEPAPPAVAVAAGEETEAVVEPEPAARFPWRTALEEPLEVSEEAPEPAPLFPWRSAPEEPVAVREEAPEGAEEAEAPEPVVETRAPEPPEPTAALPAAEEVAVAAAPGPEAPATPWRESDDAQIGEVLRAAARRLNATDIVDLVNDAGAHLCVVGVPGAGPELQAAVVRAWAAARALLQSCKLGLPGEVLISGGDGLVCLSAPASAEARVLLCGAAKGAVQPGILSMAASTALRGLASVLQPGEPLAWPEPGPSAVTRQPELDGRASALAGPGDGVQLALGFAAADGRPVLVVSARREGLERPAGFALELELAAHACAQAAGCGSARRVLTTAELGTAGCLLTRNALVVCLPVAGTRAGAAHAVLGRIAAALGDG